MENNDPYAELEIYLKQINVSAKMIIIEIYAYNKKLNKEFLCMELCLSSRKGEMYE